MGKVVNFKYLRETMEYCARFGKYIAYKQETNPVKRMDDCRSVRTTLLKDKDLEGKVKRGIRRVISYFERIASIEVQAELGLGQGY